MDGDPTSYCAQILPQDIPSAYIERSAQTEVIHPQTFRPLVLIPREQSDSSSYGPHELSYRESSRGHRRHRRHDDNNRPDGYTQEELEYYQSRNAPHYSHSNRGGDTYYIIPGGTNVIFQDEDGNEITRLVCFILISFNALIVHTQCWRLSKFKISSKIPPTSASFT
jgi:hypothetical protein